MIYYPLSTLMLAGIREILIISTPEATPLFRALLGDGSHLGLRLEYKVQEVPNGLAQAFVLGRDFIGDDPVCLILGDNLFHGQSFGKMLRAADRAAGATVFGYYVRDPERFGAVSFDDKGKAVTIEDNPAQPKSNYAVTGLYFYDNHAVRTAAALKPSARGEYEITDVNRVYLEQGRLNVKLLGRGFAWLDTGTHDSLLEAANYVRTVQSCQGLRVACVEEIAWRMGFIDATQLRAAADALGKSTYGAYLHELLARETSPEPEA